MVWCFDGAGTISRVLVHPSWRLMRHLSILILSGILLQGLPAYAQDIGRARELFQEASSLREAGMYDQAIVRLRQAIAIKDTPGLEYHAGFCESKLGHYRLAIQYYERAADLLRGGAAAPDVVTLLPSAQQAALEHVARLQIAVSNSTPSTRLRLDDEAEQPLPEGELLVDPGKHRFTISAPGFTPERQSITVAEAEHLRIDVRLTPLATGVYPAPPSTSNDISLEDRECRRRARRYGGWIGNWDRLGNAAT